MNLLDVFEIDEKILGEKQDKHVVLLVWLIFFKHFQRWGRNFISIYIYSPILLNFKFFKNYLLFFRLTYGR